MRNARVQPIGITYEGLQDERQEGNHDIRRDPNLQIKHAKRQRRPVPRSIAARPPATLAIQTAASPDHAETVASKSPRTRAAQTAPAHPVPVPTDTERSPQPPRNHAE